MIAGAWPSRAFLAAALAILLLTGAARRAQADEALLLEVIVNGRSIGKIGEFMLRDSALFSRREELRDLGFRIPDSAPTAQDGLVALAALTGLTTRLDPATQTLYVTAADDRLLPALVQAEPTVKEGPVESGIGATFGYDITGSSIGGRAIASGLFDLRGFSPWGIVSSGVLSYAGSGLNAVGSNTEIRLDSSYVYSDPESMRRYRLGDFVTGGLAWTRPVRFGGIAISSDFSMRPDLVTFPVPSVAGSAAVPSTLDVLINGTHLPSHAVQSGPFQIPQLPVVTGAGTIAMTLTDALGHQVTTTLPFYASSDLLAPGLQAYSGEVGLVRHNWGLISNDYDDLAASGTYRRGLSNAVTVEAHAESLSGLVMGGGDVVVNVDNLGVLNAAAAGSTAAGQSGAQLSMGAQRVGRMFSLGASVTAANHNFRDIAAMSGDPAPRLQVNANVGLTLKAVGSVGVAYTGTDRDTTSAPISFYTAPGSLLTQSATTSENAGYANGRVVSVIPASHAHILSSSYSRQVENLSFSATGFHDFARGGSSGLLFGLTIPLGARSSIDASGGGGSGGASAQVQAMQSATSIGDLGYQVYDAVGSQNHAFAEIQYKSSSALVSAGADRIDNQTSLRTEAQGALSFADGGLFASNTINDSFAVVDTNGAAGIRVLDENRAVGKTDSAGRLLVPDLRSFETNRLAIEPTDVPIDATVPYTTRDVRPQDRSGVIVEFPVRMNRGALLRLVDDAGHPVPVGSVATLRATGAVSPVGYDGEAYVENLGAHNDLAVEQPSGKRCGARFDYQAFAGEIPTIGPLRCKEILL